MKKFLLFTAVFLLSLLSFTTLSSQSVDYLTKAYDYLKNEYGLDKGAIGDLKIKDQYQSSHNKVTHVYLVQIHNGLEIFGTGANLAFLEYGKILSTGHRLTIIDDITLPAASTSYSASQAIGIASKELGVQSRAVPTVKRFTKNGSPVYSKEDISLQDIPVELGYLYSKGTYRLSWKMQIESRKDGDLYMSFVDAQDGKSLANDKMTLHCSFESGYLAADDQCDSHMHGMLEKFSAPPVNAFGSYKVLPLSVESPSHGSFELVTGLDDVLASPFGWHDTNGAEGSEFNYTRGNNVHAFIDRNWDYIPDNDLDGGPGLLFDFPFDPLTEPSANQDISVTNLFFWNNIMHDFTYRYGFNEVAGNFQATNYTGTGGNEDYVEAHAQFGDNDPILCGDEVNGDTDCLNNADF